MGTDVGVFYLNDPIGTSDQTWERYGDFPLLIASDIKINKKTRQLIVASYGGGVWRADLGCIFNNQEYIISGNPTWNSSMSVNQKVVIPQGATLTIKSNAEIKFSPDAKIVVQPGGELIIDGGKLTNSCGKLWQGIRVMGNKNAIQIPSNQGVLRVQNGAVIENAERAIYVGNPNNPGDNNTGGMVYIDGATFRNNVGGVEIPKYKNFFYNNPTPISNVCYIRNSTFETTDYLAQLGKTPYSFIALWGVDGIVIKGNTFKNSNPEAFQTYSPGKGIRTWSANYISQYNTFKNLRYGIYADGFGELSIFKIDTCNFSRNYTAIQLNGTHNAIVTRNLINCSGSNISTAKGIAVNACKDFNISENTITTKTNASSPTGILLYNNKQTNNTIYKNKLSDLYCGIASIENPELQFECNEFLSYNKYGIYIAKDIYWAQGTTIHPIGNKFLETCTKYDIFSKNKIIGYFYDEKNQFIPKRINEDKILLYNSHTNYTNQCPSRFGHGNSWPMDTISGLDNLIRQKRNQLNEIVDGGNTENTISNVENTLPKEALKLKKNLLEKSPNLSDTVMVTTIKKEEVLPEIMLTEVLTANSQAAKSEKVTQALNNRTNQLPDYLRDEINTGLNVISEKENLEMEISKLKNKKAVIYNQKVQQFLTDTIQSSKDSLLILLENETNLEGKYRLLAYRIAENNYVEAQKTLQSIGTDIELSSRQQAEYDKMLVFTNLQLDLLQSGKTYFEMDSTQLEQIYSLANDSLSQAGVYAKGIISLLNKTEYDLNFQISEHISKSSNSSSASQSPQLMFNITPNPANDYFIVKYELPIYNFKTAYFRMYNSDKNKVYEQKLDKRAYQLLLETASFVPGKYLCKLSADGKEYSSDFVIINPNGMIPIQKELVLETADNQGINNKLQVFPNPAKDMIFINYNLTSEKYATAKIIIIDNNGKIVKIEKLTTGSSQIKIPTSNLSNGTYNISLQSDNEIIATQTIIIKK